MKILCLLCYKDDISSTLEGIQTLDALLECVLDNKNALTILTVLFKQFPFRFVPFFY